MECLAMVSGALRKCDLIAINSKTVWVRLPDGHIIKRRNRMVVIPPQVLEGGWRGKADQRQKARR